MRQIRIRERKQISMRDFAIIKKSQDYRCRICEIKEGTIIITSKGLVRIKLTQDHIIPLSKGGKNIFQNIQALCFRCNGNKGNVYPYT